MEHLEKNCTAKEEKHFEVIVNRLDQCVNEYQNNIDKVYNIADALYSNNQKSIVEEKVQHPDNKTGIVADLRTQIDKFSECNRSLSNLLERFGKIV